jgi:acetylornithine/succinyldiaminopimelate/putrescine aminotransferase
MIDLAAGGIFAAILGADSSIIRTAVKRVKTFCSYSESRVDKWRDRYIDMLKEFTDFESVALFSTGAEATEAAWRACRAYTGKPNVWGGLIDPDEVGADHPQCDAMHGWTLGSMIMAGKMSWHELGIYPELGDKRFGQAPHSTGMMIMEPYHAPSGQFHRIDPTINRIVSLQKEFPDVLLCLDEIQGGFGRTGKLFAYQHYGDLLKPQLVTIGKLCGGGLPLSALLGPKEILESDAVKEFGHLHSTHSGNPLMCSVGCAVIEAIRKQQLIERSADLGEQMHKRLKDLPVTVHGKGLMAGLGFNYPYEAKRITALCLERGVQVVDTGRRWVKIGPQLNIEEEVLFEGIKIVKEVVYQVISERPPETCGDSGQGFEDGGSDLQDTGLPCGSSGAA